MLCNESMGPIALVIHTKRIAGGGGGWGKGWVHYFVFLPHTCHICSVQLRVAMTPPTERELAWSLPSPPLPFVSVGSPTVMWGSYRLFIAVGFVFFWSTWSFSHISVSCKETRPNLCKDSTVHFCPQKYVYTNKSSFLSSWWHRPALLTPVCCCL